MKVVVAGNGMVGFKFCEKLAARAISQKIDIIVFAEETRPAYNRVHLTDFFSGTSENDLWLSDTNWYTERNIQLHLGDPVKFIDRENQLIHSHAGIIEKYDYLILAKDSSAFVPSIPGEKCIGE